MTAVVEAHGLEKTYGDVRALTGLDLSIEEGTVLGVLGPNGAGKTTAVSILTTLIRPDAGRATVAGADLVAEPALVRARIGVSGQYAAVDAHLTGRENLDMIGRLYGLRSEASRLRAGELLERFDLVDAADRPVKTYSGGMRRRLDLAGAIVADVPVLFLDEPTTGLDPRSRLQLWDVIRDLVAGGKTLLLTTQYLEEADQLADDIIVIDKGTQIAHGTADQLKAEVGGERIEVTVKHPDDVSAAADLLASVAIGEVHAEERHLVAPVALGPRDLRRTLADLDTASIELVDAGLRRPSLDDVFLALTGHATTDDHEAEQEPHRELVEVAS